MTVRGTPVSGDPSTTTSASPQVRQTGRGGCPHQPPCPSANSPDRDAARVTNRHCDQGWSLLCNGVILFDDTGEILPTGGIIEPRRVPPMPRSMVGSGAVATRQPMAVPTPRVRTV
ncbi:MULTISPECIES: DUF5999 family protein [Protofrankia]|uniref:DUF5999 family protein n=1 Tax=Protofrankia TaxID=2994361 RepID=UPI0009FB0901